MPPGRKWRPHPELSSVFRVGARHECGSFFVANLNEPDLIGALSKRLHNSVDTVARQSKHDLDASIVDRVDENISGCGFHRAFNSLIAAPYRACIRSRSSGQRHPAERINEHYNYQDEPDDTDASAASPPRISVIATASAEQEHCENNQQQHGIVLSGSVGPNPICGQAQTKTVPNCTRRFWRPHKHHDAAENREPTNVHTGRELQKMERGSIMQTQITHRMLLRGNSQNPRCASTSAEMPPSRRTLP
jgi:hypothetical protein